MPVPSIAFLALVALASSAANATGVYRCDDNGSVSYTDRPCAAGTVVALNSASREPTLPRMSYVERVGDEPATPVTPGMSPRVVYQLLGRPRDMNVRIEGIVPIERWYYRTGVGTLAVTFRHGRVDQVAMH